MKGWSWQQRGVVLANEGAVLVNGRVWSQHRRNLVLAKERVRLWQLRGMTLAKERVSSW